MRRLLMLCLVVAVGVWFAGCGGGDSKSGSTKGSGKADEHDHDHDHDHGGEKKKDGHDHDHDHAHAKGPHGGHILELGEEEYHVEWTHNDDSGKVSLYILDSGMTKEVAIDAAEVTIETKVGDATKEYILGAVSGGDSDPPAASEFSIEDKTLVGALEAAGHEGTTAKLKVKIKGKDYSAEFTHDEHHH